MYAIIETGGLQFKVEAGMKLNVPKITGEVGDAVVIDKVYLTDDGENSIVGTPLVEGATVEAKILEHGRDKKIIVFKRKRRKGMEKKQGHRQDYTRLEIERIEVRTGKPKTEKVEAKKPKTEKVEAKKVEAKKVEAKKVEAEKVEAKKVEAKKVEAEKVEAKKVETEKAETKKVEAEKVETEKVETEKVETEKAETEKVETEKVETEKVETE